MIMLNHRLYPYKDGMTVQSLMKEKDFVFPHIIVKINGKIVCDEDWTKTPITDEDDVIMLHVFGGG